MGLPKGSSAAREPADGLLVDGPRSPPSWISLRGAALSAMALLSGFLIAFSLMATAPQPASGTAEGRQPASGATAVGRAVPDAHVVERSLTRDAARAIEVRSGTSGHPVEGGVADGWAAESRRGKDQGWDGQEEMQRGRAEEGQQNEEEGQMIEEEGQQSEEEGQRTDEGRGKQGQEGQAGQRDQEEQGETQQGGDDGRGGQEGGKGGKGWQQSKRRVEGMEARVGEGGLRLERGEERARYSMGVGGATAASLVYREPGSSSLAHRDASCMDMEELYTKADEQHQLNCIRRAQRKEFLKGGGSIKSFMEVFLMPTYPCIREERFGTWGEGGKWVCRQHRNMSSSPTAVSIGSQGEWSFEQDIAERMNAFTHTFDFTLNASAIRVMQSLPFLEFHNAGLAGAAQVRATKYLFKRGFPRARILTLPQLLRAAKLTWVDIFKMDCEGCEEGVVHDMHQQYSRSSVPFGQIQMEIHNVHVVNETGNSRGKLRHEYHKTGVLLAKLEALGYRLFHVEPNVWCPRCFEMAFIHESLVRPRDG